MLMMIDLIFIWFSLFSVVLQHNPFHCVKFYFLIFSYDPPCFMPTLYNQKLQMSDDSSMSDLSMSDAANER